MKRNIIFVLLILAANWALAYPEMIRHGYSQCMACHVSPTGGGLVTTYGRSISKELLSRWSSENEEQIFHGVMADSKIVEWIDGSKDVGFNVGGNLRYIQLWQNSEAVRRGRSFAMQRDLDVAFKYNQFTALVSYGFLYSPNTRDELDLRRAYLLWNDNENYSVRIGRFLPNYGIMFSDHYTVIKQGLELGQNTERNTVEAQFTFESFGGTLSYSQTPFSRLLRLQEEAVAVNLNYNVSDTIRLSTHYWAGDYLGRKRDITGVNALVGINKKLYSLSEVDLQAQVSDSGLKQKGLFYFQRVGYEWIKGLHALLQFEGSQSDLSSNRTSYFSHGAGFNLYPRPHFELQFLWMRPKFENQKTTDTGFLNFHYYL